MGDILEAIEEWLAGNWMRLANSRTRAARIILQEAKTEIESLRAENKCLQNDRRWMEKNNEQDQD